MHTILFSFELLLVYHEFRVEWSHLGRGAVITQYIFFQILAMDTP